MKVEGNRRATGRNREKIKDKYDFQKKYPYKPEQMRNYHSLVFTAFERNEDNINPNVAPLSQSTKHTKKKEKEKGG